MTFDPHEYSPQMIIEASFSEANAILREGIFSPEGSRSPFFKACLTLLLINANDILQTLSKIGHRVSTKEHVDQSIKSSDLTDLISACRNAACHQASLTHNFKSSRLQYVRLIGQCSMMVDDVVLSCEFDDDQAVFWGGSKLLLKRNLGQAFNSAQLICNQLEFITSQ